MLVPTTRATVELCGNTAHIFPTLSSTTTTTSSSSSFAGNMFSSSSSNTMMKADTTSANTNINDEITNVTDVALFSYIAWPTEKTLVRFVCLFFIF
jgi:hypothetical protein